MKRLTVLTSIALAIAASAALLDAQTIPADAKATCTVTAPVFNSWFETGTPSLNGVVKPANSVTFPNTPNCSFYQWSKQMFLWLTSPAPPTYGGGSRIFDSPTFYDVSPPDAGGNRTFIPHAAGRIPIFALRAAQAGPHGLQIIFDKAGRMFEVKPAPAAANAKPMVRNSAGKLVEIGSATRSMGGRLTLTDKTGKAIQLRAAPTLKTLTRKELAAPLASNTATRFMINKIPIFVDPSLNVIDTEEGQADDGVLLAQSGSLVYYATMVNDVFAYFLTGTKNGGILPKPTQFPTTAADLAKITTFASGHGKTFPDANALAIEVKSSWVEASSLPNVSNYITMRATVPSYDKSNPTQWVPNGQKTVLLALVGMHVVGSAAGHPEMIWATFEHFNNAPNATYTYNSNTGAKTVNQNTAGTWVFATNGAAAPFNVMHEQFLSPNIVGISGGDVIPSNVIRWKAWGAASNLSPNPIDGSAAASNTEIISIHNSVAGMMPAGDIRNNYMMTGSTWTIGGAAPTLSNQVGTSRLSNTTMETFVQGSDNTSNQFGTNCFSCHTGNGTGVSHVFPALKALF
jgi:hypothetical protein